jgi:hypothetical protein
MPTDDAAGFASGSVDDSIWDSEVAPAADGESGVLDDTEPPR